MNICPFCFEPEEDCLCDKKVSSDYFIGLDEMFPEFAGNRLPFRYELLIWWCNLKGRIRELLAVKK